MTVRREKRRGAIVPENPSAPPIKRYAICLPDDPQWRQAYTGLLLLPTYRYYWDSETGDVEQATQTAKEIWLKWIEQECSCRCLCDAIIDSLQKAEGDFEAFLLALLEEILRDCSQLVWDGVMELICDFVGKDDQTQQIMSSIGYGMIDARWDGIDPATIHRDAPNETWRSSDGETGDILEWRDAALCWALRAAVDGVCDDAIATINETGDHIAIIAAAFGVAAVITGGAAAIVAGVLAAGVALAGEVWVEIGESELADEQNRNDVACALYCALRDKEPSPAGWLEALSEVEVPDFRQDFWDTVRQVLAREQTYLSLINVLAHAWRDARDGLIGPCCCTFRLTLSDYTDGPTEVGICSSFTLEGVRQYVNPGDPYWNGVYTIEFSTDRCVYLSGVSHSGTQFKTSGDSRAWCSGGGIGRETIPTYPEALGQINSYSLWSATPFVASFRMREG